FVFVRPFTCSAPVFTSLPRVSAGTHNHMHAQNAHCGGFGCFFCSVCWRLRVAAASSVGMKGGRREGARTASHSSSGCDARGGLRLLWRAASFRSALLRRCAVRLRMPFIVRVRAGDVFPGRWAATICRWRFV
ncbi:trans-sialidase, partial [Trypanosoma cruzi]